MAFQYFWKCPTLCFSVNISGISQIDPKIEDFLLLINFMATFRIWNSIACILVENALFD